MENKQEEIDKEAGIKEESGYYDKQPNFVNRGPSKWRKQWNNGKVYFLVIAAAILFYFFLLRLTSLSGVLWKVVDVLRPVIYGIAIAYLINPMVKFLERGILPVLKKKIKKNDKAEKISRGIGVFISLIILLALVIGLCNMVIPELYRSIRNMIYTLPNQLQNVVERFNAMGADDTTTGLFLKNIMTQATDYIETWLRTDLLKQTNVIMSSLTEGVIGAISGVFHILIGIIVSAYLLFSKESFSAQTKKVLYAFVKPEYANMTLHITAKSNDIFGGFIIGKIIDSAIIGVLCFLGLWVLKIPYAMLVSVVVGVTNVIPFFGPYIGAIPSAILILLADPRKGIYFIIFIFLLQQLDGNVIGPKILGNSTGLSAFWVVFSILLGGGLFGFVGMIMGVPTFGVLYYIVQTIVNQKLAKKHLPTHSDHYDEMSYVRNNGEYVRSRSEAEKGE